LTTKIHLLADSLGRPVAVAITPGQAHDLVAAEALLAGQIARYVLADRAHDAQHLREAIEAAGAEPVIPPNPTRKHPANDARIRYRDRNRIERLWARLKEWRAVATRYEKIASILGVLALAAALDRLRR
jgi:transposase